MAALDRLRTHRALVESWSPPSSAVGPGRDDQTRQGNVLAAGGITETEAEQYRAALEAAFTFRVTWIGDDATPSFSGIGA